jgi:integrase
LNLIGEPDRRGKRWTLLHVMTNYDHLWQAFTRIHAASLPNWYCAYRLPNGKRAFKSTKLTDRDKAQEFCRTLARASQLGSNGNLTEARARELISEIVENTLGEPLKFYTAEEWLRDWLEGKKTARSNATYLKYRHTIDAFIASVGAKAKRNLNQVTPRDVQRFRDGELAAGKHPTTCNYAVKHIRIPFNVARRQGLITHNPAEAVEMIDNKDEQASKGTFDIEQLQAILKAAPLKDWRGAILLAFYTGARLQDVANMRWKSVDLQDQLISFRAGKTKELVTVPMHSVLESYLLEMPAPDNAKAFLFPSLAGKRTSGKSGLSMSFSKIMEKAKVKGEVARERKGKGRTINTLSFHSLRHSFNSIMANAGVSQEVRQKLTGHSSADMNKRYTHHEVEPLRAAIAKIPSVEL